MISVPYKSAFGHFTRPNAPELPPDGEVDAASVSATEPSFRDLRTSLDLRSSSSSTLEPSLPGEEPSRETASIAPPDPAAEPELFMPLDADIIPPAPPELDDADTSVEDDPEYAGDPEDEGESLEIPLEEDSAAPTTAQKVKAGFAVLGAAGLLYFLASKKMR